MSSQEEQPDWRWAGALRVGKGELLEGMEVSPLCVLFKTLMVHEASSLKQQDLVVAMFDSRLQARH